MRQLDRSILRLAVPSIVQNVTVPLLGLVDLTVAGHLGATSVIASIAVASMLFNLTYWLLGFLRMGTSGLTSQALGRCDFADVKRILRLSLRLSFAIGIVLVLFQNQLLSLGLFLIKPSSNVVSLVSVYFHICIWGAPAVLSLFALNGWFIGNQDTKTPLYVAIVQNVLNIVLSVFFVFVSDLGIAGLAFGTLIAQWTGFVLSALIAFRRCGRIVESANSIPHLTSVSQIFAVNRDLFLRTIFLVGVNLFFTRAGAIQGDLILSANATLLTFFTIFSYFMDGFAFAAEALCGKSVVSSDETELKATINRLFVWGWIMVAIFTLVYAVGGRFFVSLITDHADVVEMSNRYYWWVLVIPVAGTAAFLYDGIFVGMTETRGMLVSSVVSAIVFFGLFAVGYYCLDISLLNHSLWFSFIVYLALRGAIQWRWMKELV